MIGHRRRLAVIAATAVFVYVGGGHSAGTMAADHEGMAGAEMGICLVLVAFLIVTAFPQRALQQTRLNTLAPASPPAASAASRRTDGRSRASPIRLQRFRN